MDPALDPPPVAAQPAVAIHASATTAVTAAAAVQPAAHNHPPYAEMISAAIAALKERDGSSKRAIAKYIETQYSDLPPTHSALLTHHLKRLKTNGQLLMVKHSYKLPGPRSAPAAVNGGVNVESADPASSVAKRRPGRPPKPKTDAVQAAVPVFPPPINMNDVPVFAPEAQPPANITVPLENVYNAAAPVNGATAVGPVRGRGRPPKQGGAKRGPGRPAKGGGGGGVARGRGRPRKNAAPVAAPPSTAGRGKGPGRPRGRPPKPINVVEGFATAASLGGGIEAAPVGVAPPAVSPLAGKRRGRPPKAGNEAKKARHMNAALPKKPRKLSGKPLGRPRKNSEESANRTADSSQLLVAYLDLKAKLENLQSMVKQTVTLVRPSLNSEAAINAIQELELVAMNAGAPPNVVQIQQQQPLPEQVQPQS
ncbi:hypothetical protein C2S53_001878 [Perilla frutescens var. hirtella]|uniref:H15 domain-containing protein n=1 Tax=Perilla frutescens var. hirtella TaxID=608512 RepID=A0AAD4P094_PERFH|nr:hypothetical protein C2S53_001878 [Perilla frutescens var. hirtella]